MLRIVRIDTANGGCLLRLEGRLIGAWVDELRRSCDEARATATRLALDLAHVSFADREGIMLLQALGEREVALVNCSPFVTEQLKAWIEP
jgi:anti-anti-sigma regulatory factor